MTALSPETAATETPESETPPYGAWALEFLDRHGYTVDQQVDLETLLQSGYVRVSLGVFDVHYPRSFLADRRHASQFQDLALAMVQVQDQWIRWFRGEPPPRRRSSRREPVSAHLEVIADWVDDWKTSQVVKIGKARTALPDTLFLDPEPEIVEALAAFRQEMLSGAALGLSDSWTPASSEPVTFVFAPNRSEFLGLSAFVGSLGSPQRSLLWVPTIPVWTEFRWNGMQFLALEYASSSWRTDPTGATNMDSREKTGVLQHVLHHVTGQLVRFYHGQTLDPAVEGGMDVKMVIDLLGENNARAGGSSDANATAARSKFVPGYTNGGRLPPINADSRWREDKGRDYFIDTLRRALRDGRGQSRRKKGEQPVPQFPLDGTQGKVNVPAPFLGRDIAPKDIPEHAASDYREFFRAYRTAFVHWLRQESGEWNGDPSEAAFGRLLLEMLGEERAFEQVLERIYGIPFSAPDPSTDSLEWRFLEWLEKR